MPCHSSPCLLPLAFWRRAGFESFQLVCAPLPSSRKRLWREWGWFEPGGCNLLNNEFISGVLVAKSTELYAPGLWTIFPSTALLCWGGYHSSVLVEGHI